MICPLGLMFHNDLAQAYFLVIFRYYVNIFAKFPKNAPTDGIFDNIWLLPFVVSRLFRSRLDKVTAKKFFDPTVSVDTFRSEAFISVFAYEDLIRHSVEQVKKLLLL